MPRGLSKKAKPWEKVLLSLIDGKVKSKEEIEKYTEYKHMYRISHLMLNIKYNSGVIKVEKSGRKVIGYQLLNVKEMKEYLIKRNLLENKTAEKIRSLDELKTESVETTEEEVA